MSSTEDKIKGNTNEAVGKINRVLARPLTIRG